MPIAVAPAIMNSIASETVVMPPCPMIGTPCTFATS